MTRISFYALSQGDTTSPLSLACRVAEKARLLGHRVCIQAFSPEQARQLDDLLWQFKASSFLPHLLLANGDEGTESVLVTGNTIPTGFDDVIINLGEAPCRHPRQFTRVNEIIAADEDSRALGRERYRYYQSQGYQPETYKL